MLSITEHYTTLIFNNFCFSSDSFFMVSFCKLSTSRSCSCSFLKARAWSEGVMISIMMILLICIWWQVHLDSQLHRFFHRICGVGLIVFNFIFSSNWNPMPIDSMFLFHCYQFLRQFSPAPSTYSTATEFVRSWGWSMDRGLLVPSHRLLNCSRDQAILIPAAFETAVKAV